MLATFAKAVLQDPANLPHLEPVWARDEKYSVPGSLGCSADFWHSEVLPTLGVVGDEAEEILAWLTEGLDVRHSFLQHFRGDFKGTRYDTDMPQAHADKNPSMMPESRAYASAEIRRLEGIGLVSKSTDKPHLVMFVNMHFNASGKPCLIYDARRLNLFERKFPLKYENLRGFQRGLKRGSLMWSLDHRSGYHHVSIAKDSRTLMGFEWNGEWYVWNVLPFGWAPACSVYSRLSGLLAAYLRKHGIHTMVYIDDMGFFVEPGASPARQHRQIWSVMAVMYLAGFTVALEKSVLRPAMTVQLLGFTIDSEMCQFSVPEAKLKKLLDLLEGAAAQKRLWAKELQSRVGRLQALMLAVPCVGTFLVSSYRALADSEVDRGQHSHVRVTNDLVMRADFCGFASAGALVVPVALDVGEAPNHALGN
jgi:hypothetical protein